MNSDFGRAPFLLTPVGKDYLWGGERLKTEYGKKLPETPLAESWECAVHPSGNSAVASGPYKGQTLEQVLKARPDFMGTHATNLAEQASGSFPVLIKLIDAAKPLSVQVHPNDEQARELEKSPRGKTEMWYIVDAAPGATITYGFYHDMTPEEVRLLSENGSLLRYLQQVPVKKGDLFIIEPGRVHALGEGVLVAEIQENSDITYRLYDYHRKDKNGEERELHLEKALRVLDYKKSSNPRQPMRTLRFRPGWASELLCRCKYFQTERVLLHTDEITPEARFETGPTSFQVFLCVNGKLEMGRKGENANKLSVERGDCVFVPAGISDLWLSGNAELLKVTC